MEPNEKSGGVRRRQLMKGAAWAAPGAIVATAAPAYAASPCEPYIQFIGGSVYNQGTLNSGTTTQTASFGGETWVYNLPATVTVTNMTYEFWIQNRLDTTTAVSGPGLYWLGNAKATQVSSCTAGGGCDPLRANPRCGSNTNCNPTITAPFNPTAGSGFSTQVSSTANRASTLFPNGVTAQAWNLIMTWKSSQDSNPAGRYKPSSGAGQCRTFDSGASRRFQITYEGVRALTDTDLAANGSYLSFVKINVVLSNGKQLNYTSNVLGPSASHT